MYAHRGTDTVSAVFLSPFVTLLALAALLFGVFTLHSEATGHDMHMAGPSLSATVNLPVDAATTAAAGLAVHVVASLSADTHTGMLDCALLAMACVLLLVLAALVFLTRLPATFQRLVEPGGTFLGVVTSVAVPAPRPSLTVLSITRV